MNKIFLSLLIFISLINIVSADSLIINNLNANKMIQPYNEESYQCSHTGFDSCLGVVGNNSFVGQAIKIDDNIGTISSIKVILNRYSGSPQYYPYNATITLRVYKSTDNLPTSSKYLVDSYTYNPSNSNPQSYSLSFGTEIDVYDNINQTQKIVNWLWIELQESYNNIDYNTPVLFGVYTSQNDIYSNSDMYQCYFDRTGCSLFESHYPVSWFTDIGFSFYGTFHFPTTPLPTPVQTGNGSEELPCYDCNGTIPSIDTGSNTSWLPSFNDSEILCPECIGNETINPYDVLPSDSTTNSFLETLGYCNTLGCTLFDIIDFFYDITFFMIYFSFIVIIGKWYFIWRHT